MRVPRRFAWTLMPHVLLVMPRSATRRLSARRKGDDHECDCENEDYADDHVEP